MKIVKKNIRINREKSLIDSYIYRDYMISIGFYEFRNCRYVIPVKYYTFNGIYKITFPKNNSEAYDYIILVYKTVDAKYDYRLYTEEIFTDHRELLFESKASTLRNAFELAICEAMKDSGYTEEWYNIQ